MTVNTIVAIIVAVLTLALLIVGGYFYFRDRTLNQVRADIYQLFLQAEHNPEVMASGKQKMKWVLSQARGLLPGWLQLLITDECLERIVESWFRAVKDLLDDGKYNHSDDEVEE